MKNYFIVLLILFSGFSQLSAKDFSSTIVNINAAGFPKIQVDLKVFNKNAEDLQSDHFSIHEDQQPISSFAISVQKNRHFMTLVIDRSSSIQPAMSQVKNAAAAFVQSMTDSVNISILSFASDLDFNHRFSNDTKSLTEAIDKIRPWGGTALYDAIFAAAEELHGKASRNDLKTIVCLTDGRDSRPNGESPMSSKSPQEVIEYAIDKKVRIITVGLGNDLDEGIMKSFAQNTGGWYLKSTTAEQLSKLYQALSRRMKLEKYYRLVYTTPRPEPDGSKRKVEVSSRLKGQKDQGTGFYTAPTRTAHIPDETSKTNQQNKMSFEMVFSDLKIEGPDTVFLTGPITPPPDSPVIGPNAASFLGNSSEENLAIIEQARNRIAAEHKQNYDQTTEYLDNYLLKLERLQKTNDEKAARSDLQDFEKPRIDYRNKFLENRRQEINLHKNMAYEKYCIKFRKSEDELEYFHQIQVLQGSEIDDFFFTNNASAEAKLRDIEQKYDLLIEKCRLERNELFDSTIDQRGSHVTHTTHTETFEIDSQSLPEESDGPGHSAKDIKNFMNRSISGHRQNLDEMNNEIPELKTITPFD
jgi:VWFA-related protein